MRNAAYRSRVTTSVNTLITLSCVSFLATAAPTAEAQKKTSGSKVTTQSLQLNEQGARAVKEGRFDDAEQLFKKSLRKDTSNTTAVVNLAGMYITNKKENLAINLLSDYVKKAPSDAYLQARLGDAFFAAKKPSQAIAAYEKALRLDSSLVSPLARLASLYTMSSKLQKARDLYIKAVAANPKDGRSLNNLSSLYLGLGDPKNAIKTAKQALRVLPTSDTYVTLGSAYQRVGDKRNALHSFKRALKLGNKEPKLMAVIKELEDSQGKTQS